ncbi:type II toxin-antitoxin system RelE/ParE family toxin [Cronobacter muytjensii]|uniref:type II toxin-antitoxin system RelE/ParE family toxin n=1 Tax=Cronobacter muytjensii TaxID=413501 RepID=UPI0003A70EFF|nr:type II toxin-antitoxin system RelE/ParE family toxin [Cronobacter muytjensii]ALB72693.1 addiction module antitoxin [Cronobacter muytjensii ATCC 51329]ELY6344493.1 type II toxin-antitoxin system RelE/ParE family toxin [Cronobacter muytjensii]NUW59601.1 type II toxin-antitoxin system RelE/ParE family toxin [Cronobacter muytjensii]
MRPIQWTEAAKTDLFALISVVASDNPSAAQALLTRIEASILPAAHYPEMFREGRVADTREIIAHPNNIVVYNVTSEYLLVLSVLHARQQFP